MLKRLKALWRWARMDRMRYWFGYQPRRTYVPELLRGMQGALMAPRLPRDLQRFQTPSTWVQHKTGMSIARQGIGVRRMRALGARYWTPEYTDRLGNKITLERSMKKGRNR